MKIGFIGAGNMASAIIKGIITQKQINPRDILVSSLETPEFLKLVGDTCVSRCSSNQEAAEQAEMLILAVKPNVIPQVLEEISPILVKRKPLVVSIAAGTTLEKLQNLAGKNVPIVRVMPNVNAVIGEGAAAVCGNKFATEAQVDEVLRLFKAVGKAWKIEEKDFSNFAAIAGCSPAYTYLFIDAISRAGVKNGLPKDLATQIAAQAVLGSAKMVAASDENPWGLIDKVCSPGGTTIAGLAALEDRAFLSTVMQGIQAAIDKDEELQKK